MDLKELKLVNFGASAASQAEIKYSNFPTGPLLMIITLNFKIQRDFSFLPPSLQFLNYRQLLFLVKVKEF